MDENRTVVTVTLGEIYKTLTEVRDDVRDLKSGLEELADDSKDHENRIRTLEKRLYTVTGAASVIASIGGFLLNRLFGA